MTAYTLPKSALIDKFIPKTTIFKKAEVDYKTKDNFSQSIQRITRKYKLAENTIGIPKGETVEEIHIFEIQLKEREIPTKELSIINKKIPYPILFECVFNNDVAYAIKYDKEYFISDWNADIQFELNGVNLDKVYEKIISKFILGNEGTISGSAGFGDVMDWHTKVKQLTKDIEKLEDKIKKEIQYNRKVPLNIELQKKKKELDNLLSHKTN